MARLKLNNRDNRERGLTMIEVMISVVLLLVASSAMVSGLVLSGTVDHDGNRRHAAMEAVLSLADEIRATPIDSIASTFGDASDSRGQFSIPALEEEGGELAGRIRVLTDETLSDDDIGVLLGMPRDLDGDGIAESKDVSSTALVMPVIIEARWGPAGRRELFRVPVVLIR